MKSNITVMIMSFMDRIKQAKSDREEAVWSINKKRGLIHLESNYMQLKRIPSGEDIVFYKDITKIEKKRNFIEIKTNTSEFKIAPIKLRGAEEAANELYIQVLEKVNESKE